MAKRRRSKRRSATNVPLILGSIGLGTLIIAMVGGFIWLKTEANAKIALDKVTRCPLTGPISVTAVLFDTTDPILAITSTDLKNRFDQIGAAVPVGGLLSISELTSISGDLKPVFNGCNPGMDEDRWTNNPKLAKKQWEESFKKPLEQARESIGVGTTGEKSPIMAGIQSVKLHLFDRIDLRELPKQLVVASDMVENTDSYNQYKSGAAYAAFENSRAKREFHTNLKGVELSILYVKRKNFAAGYQAHAEFWSEWAKASGASDFELDSLEGLN